MDFQVGEEEPLPGVGDHLTAMTQVRSKARFSGLWDMLDKYKHTSIIMARYVNIIVFKIVDGVFRPRSTREPK